jgi:hypothetical protein
MAGPKTPQEALAWIQEAVASGLYTPSVHLEERFQERGLDIHDVHNAIANAGSCDAYENGQPRHGGTSWRIHGPSVGDDKPSVTIAVGVEAYLDKKRRRCIICTIFKV